MERSGAQFMHREARAGSFAVDRLETLSEARAPFHYHKEVVVSVLLRGSVTDNTEKKSTLASPGVVIVERPQTGHETIYGKGGGTFLRLILSAELERFLELEGAAHPGNSHCHEIARGMAACVDSADPLALECAGLELMGSVTNGPDWLPRSHPDYLRDLVAGLRTNQIPAHGISAIAKEARVSPTRLVRTFRRSYGISIARFLRLLQLQRASALLTDPTIAISAVAAEAGFSDQSHMTREFVRTYGTTPARLRKELPQSSAV
jgi:AraC family transcriptional regulator